MDELRDQMERLAISDDNATISTARPDATPHAQPGHKSATLLGLPGELRNNILSMLLTDDQPINAFNVRKFEPIPSSSLDPRVAAIVGVSGKAKHLRNTRGLALSRLSPLSVVAYDKKLSRSVFDSDCTESLAMLVENSPSRDMVIEHLRAVGLRFNPNQLPKVPANPSIRVPSFMAISIRRAPPQPTTGTSPEGVPRCFCYRQHRCENVRTLNPNKFLGLRTRQLRSKTVAIEET